ncbi:MAG: efflux RND transporter periplasmic adaptor subunit [Phycisphaerae bacterium]|nr:efflux RND transporter periplasmic adaptor subunit [Phycisphaerae bacterium]
MKRIIGSIIMAVWGGRKLAALVAVLVFLMLWLSGTFVKKIEGKDLLDKPSPPPALKTSAVELKQYPLTLKQVGTVQTRVQVEVAGRIMAQVLEVPVQEGQAVAGQDGQTTVLARLDGRDIEAKLRQAQTQTMAAEEALTAAKAQLGAAQAQQQAAEAQLGQTETDLKRIESLFAAEAATGQQRDHAVSQRDIAQANLLAARQQVVAAQSDIARFSAQREQAVAAVNEAQVMLSFTTITAPMNGRLVRKMIDPGDMVTPGQHLFVIETTTEPELHAVVAESLTTHLSSGQKLAVKIDALNTSLEGIVREILPQADPRSRTMMVKVSLPVQQGLITGQFGTLEVPTGNYSALTVPSRAVRQVGQLHLVDVVDSEDRPHRRFVTLGPPHGEVVEVLSGLVKNESVVIP